MTWDEVRARVAALPRGGVLAIPKGAIAHPASAGAVRAVGLPVGQLRDFRFPPDRACQGVHVHEYARDWRVHLDRVHPSCSLLGHFFADVLPW